MFPAGDGKWEPYKINEIKKAAAAVTNGADTTMNEAGAEEKKDDDDEAEFEEDLESEEGAVYPLTGMALYDSAMVVTSTDT